MKWFTRDWANGGLSDLQVEFVQHEYADHAARLRRTAPGLAVLLDLDVHDGQVQEWNATEGMLQWRLLVGDLQCGYEYATVEYDGAQVVGGVDALRELRLDADDLEVLYDELDIDKDGGLLHRLLF